MKTNLILISAVLLCAILEIPANATGTGINVFDFMTQAQIDDVESGLTLLDLHGPIQTAIDYVNSLPQNNRPSIYFPPGRYGIASTIQLHNNIALVGEPRDIGYWYSFNHSSELVALSTMSSMIDITGNNIYIGYLGLYGNTVAAYGLYTAGTFGRASGNSFEYLSLSLFSVTAIYLNNIGLTKLSNIQISDCVQCGIDCSGFGDADLNNLYINTINQDSASVVNGPSGANVYGVGIRLRYYSGNINIRGGKIEFTRVGILLNSVNGVNITGVNFDANRKASILCYADSMNAYPNVTTENASAVTSVMITGNRFLGGAKSTSQIPSAHIFSIYSRYLTIVGNGFKRADDGARDFSVSGGGTQGPDYGIWLWNSELCLVSGNDLYGAAYSNCLRIENVTPSTAAHTVNCNTLDGTELINSGSIKTQPSYGSIVFSSDSNPIAKSTAKAWVRFNGNGGSPVIKAAYNVSSVTGSAGTYSVTFSSPMNTNNYSTLVSVAKYFGFRDSGLYGTATVNSVTIYSISNGVLSANGDISVTIFGP